VIAKARPALYSAGVPPSLSKNGPFLCRSSSPLFRKLMLNWGCRTDGRSLVVMFAIFRGQHDVKNQDFQHRLELDFPGET
jgi:hypothetical protein